MNEGPPPSEPGDLPQEPPASFQSGPPPAAPPELSAGPPEPPARSNATNWLLGAILVALIAIGAVLFLGGGDEIDTAATTTTSTTEAPVDESTTTTAADTTTSTAAETTTTTSTPETTTTSTEATTTTTQPADDAALAAAAVGAWIDAVAVSDTDAAWALMAPESQEAAGGRSGFDDMASALAEGFGAWADATSPTGEREPWVLTNEVESEVFVVSLAGNVTQEGTETQRATAIPVVIRDGQALVQPFLRSDTVALQEPSLPEPLEFSDTSLVVQVPAGGDVAMFIMESALGFDVEADGDVAVATSDPIVIEAGGRNVLTVVYWDDDVLHAEAWLGFTPETS